MSVKDKVDMTIKKKEDIPVELESQFILRLPSDSAVELRKLVRLGNMNVKDQLTVQLETDMRHGVVRFGQWVYSAKVMDLPCVVESLKTIDRKTFYKTADICQMIVCKDEDDSQTTEDEESPKKKDDKDRSKADRKFFWPHGLTPPLKNVRKRRFRKTLRKKYVEAPEIEKEVKRLFRVDNEAVHSRYEIIMDDEDSGKKPLTGDGTGSNAGSPAASALMSNSQSLDVAEHDLFGDDMSTSDDDEGDVNIMDSGDEDSLMQERLDNELVTEFTKRIMYRQSRRVSLRTEDDDDDEDNDDFGSSEQDNMMVSIEESECSVVTPTEEPEDQFRKYSGDGERRGK